MNKPVKIRKLLIANRGEIARRIIRTCVRLEIATVVIYHGVDAKAPFVIEADEAIEIHGETPTAAYLDISQIVTVARENTVDAIHPGYGFLAENRIFAQAISQAGLVFIGPAAEAIGMLGDKVASREFVAAHGFPLAPAIEDLKDGEQLLAAAKKIGFPVLIKASAGGGGKGMHIVYEPAGFIAAFELAASEAQRYFGDPRVYCEKYLLKPRHIEVQILSDKFGNCVHLGERECSVQRRFQKVIEESPAPNLSKETRERICESAVGIAQAAEYTNAGTVEFIMDKDENFYFLEMNTRLQVEHPVTEMVTGIDLVEAQINVAAGLPLPFKQADIRHSGHAIELRICAEDADQDFIPATGKVCFLQEPKMHGIRLDSSLHAGTEVTTAFDPMLAKLIAHADSRESAREKLIAALHEQVILGVTTNSAFLERILGHPSFISGEIHTHFIQDHAESLKRLETDEETLTTVLVAAALNDQSFLKLMNDVPEPYSAMGNWRNA